MPKIIAIGHLLLKLL